MPEQLKSVSWDEILEEMHQVRESLDQPTTGTERLLVSIASLYPANRYLSMHNLNQSTLLYLFLNMDLRINPQEGHVLLADVREIKRYTLLEARNRPFLTLDVLQRIIVLDSEESPRTTQIFRESGVTETGLLKYEHDLVKGTDYQEG